MKYILIVIMSGTYPFSFTAEFNGQFQCDAARVQIVKDLERFPAEKLKLYCFAKG
jgi:hypothetical protein